MEIETLNMRTVPLTRILLQLEHQLEDGDYTPVTVLGKSGIGKTESISALAHRLGIGFRELRLSHYQESDLIGLPYIDKNGRTCHATSDLLPDSNDPEQGILMLDEVTSAPKSMRSAVYQLLDSSRSLGQYRLPPRWLVVACGNGPDDGGDFRGIEPAFLSRGFCWRVEENLRVWKDWAVAHGVHPAVIAFLSFQPESLHVMDLDRPFDMIACPRNWVKLSTQLKNMEARTPGGVILDESELEFAADGCVGCRCGPGFTAFYQYKKQLIDPQQILAGQVAPEQLKDLRDEVLYLTAQALVQQLVEDIRKNLRADGFSVEEDCLERVANVCNWIIDVGEQVRLDTAISMLQDLTASVGATLRTLVLSDAFDAICPRFVQFAVDNAIVL